MFSFIFRLVHIEGKFEMRCHPHVRMNVLKPDITFPRCTFFYTFTYIAQFKTNPSEIKPCVLVCIVLLFSYL